MKKLLFAAFVIAAVFLPGCTPESSDSLFQAPKLPGDYVALQASLDSIAASGAIPAAPDSGSNRHSVQLVDIDADGSEEAVSFFRDSIGGTQFSIYLHKKNQNGDYVLIGSLSGHGTGIDSVYYPRCSETGAAAVVISLSSGEDISGNLIAGSVDGGVFSSILETSCTDIYVGNINQSVTDELIVVQKGGDVSQFSAKLYYFDGNSIASMPSAALSAGIKGIAGIRKGSLYDGQEAVFIDSVFSGRGYLTDVLIEKGDTFSNITLDATSGMSDSTYRQVSVPSSDIRGNGIYAIPLAYPMEGTADSSEIQWRLEWNAASSDGSLTPMLTTYHNISEEWYITFPDKWDDKITAKKGVESGAGFTTFSEAQSSGSAVPLFTLYAVPEEDRQLFDNREHYICIGASSSKSYYIVLADAGRDSKYFLSEDEIRASFSIIPKVWASEVYGS